MLSRLDITFLSRSKRLLISWLQSPSAVILEPKKRKSDTVSPSLCHEVMGPDSMVLVFWMLSFKPTFSVSSFTFIKRLFNSSSLSAIRVMSSAYLRFLIFLPAVLIPACASSSPAFLMMHSAYKLNKQGDNTHHCSHVIKRHLLLGRKAMTNLGSGLKSRDITLLTKVHTVKAMVFPVMYRCESWTIKKAECQRTDAFKLQCWKRLLRVPWTARRSNQPILKEISPEYSLEGLMLKLKLPILWSTWYKELTHWKKTLMLGKIEGRRRRGW